MLAEFTPREGHGPPQAREDWVRPQLGSSSSGLLQIFGIPNPAIYDQESLGDCARLYAKTLASVNLNARATGRQARALDPQASPSLPVHALLTPCVPSRRKPVPSKYLCAEPRIAQPGLGDPGPLGADLGACSRPVALYLLGRPGRVRLGPGLLGEFYVIAHGACERRCK